RTARWRERLVYLIVIERSQPARPARHTLRVPVDVANADRRVSLSDPWQDRLHGFLPRPISARSTSPPSDSRLAGVRRSRRPRRPACSGSNAGIVAETEGLPRDDATPAGSAARCREGPPPPPR